MEEEQNEDKRLDRNSKEALKDRLAASYMLQIILQEELENLEEEFPGSTKNIPKINLG